MNKIIKELAKIGRDYFENSFHFKSEANLFIAKSSNTSRAINKRKNSQSEVKVINWFDDLWTYIEIKYIPQMKGKNTIPNIFFSLSVFQGQASDDTKLQLLRAEWDNYDEPSNKHPQPHWHVYSMKDFFISDNFKEVVKSEENPFNQFIQDNSNKTIDTDRLHFAMNGQWSDNKTDIHTISAESDLVNWFKGLLNHLKSELKYVKERKRLNHYT
jgi:hypothetical protein